MKRLNYWMMAVLIAGMHVVPMQALTLPQDEPVIVYYMPLTQVRLTAEYDEIVTEVGPFYQYSERYLGTKDVITKAEHQYALTGIKYNLQQTADTMRAYVLQDKNVRLQWVSLTPNGTLAGYNIQGKEAKDKPKSNGLGQRGIDKTDVLTGTPTTRLMPLMEEQLMASSTAKMAEGAAKQIYRIREMRLNLLAGDVEKAPVDGAAIERILAEMDKREQELTALFVGRRTVTHHRHYCYYTPGNSQAKQETSILMRFSKHYGVVAADDLSGEPVTIHLSKSTHQLYAADKPSKSTPSLYYNLPGTGLMTVTYGEQQMLSKQIDVAQWGVSVPVNNALLDGKTKIRFNPQTGNIVSIEQ